MAPFGMTCRPFSSFRVSPLEKRHILLCSELLRPLSFPSPFCFVVRTLLPALTACFALVLLTLNSCCAPGLFITAVLVSCPWVECLALGWHQQGPVNKWQNGEVEISSGVKSTSYWSFIKDETFEGRTHMYILTCTHTVTCTDTHTQSHMHRHTHTHRVTCTGTYTYFHIDQADTG